MGAALSQNGLNTSVDPKCYDESGGKVSRCGSSLSANGYGGKVSRFGVFCDDKVEVVVMMLMKMMPEAVSYTQKHRPHI